MMKNELAEVFEKLDALNQVAAFHKTFQHPIESTPIIPSESRCKLRVSLLAEELKEFEDGGEVSAEDILATTEAMCRRRPGFQTRAVWMQSIA